MFVRRAAHFAHYQVDDEDEEDNAHVGGTEVILDLPSIRTPNCHLGLGTTGTSAGKTATASVGQPEPNVQAHLSLGSFHRHARVRLTPPQTCLLSQRLQSSTEDCFTAFAGTKLGTMVQCPTAGGSSGRGSSCSRRQAQRHRRNHYR